MTALKNRVAQEGWNEGLLHEVIDILDDAAQKIERAKALNKRRSRRSRIKRRRRCSMTRCPRRFFFCNAHHGGVDCILNYARRGVHRHGARNSGWAIPY